jgi:hypothetical protein
MADPNSWIGQVAYRLGVSEITLYLAAVLLALVAFVSLWSTRVR